MAILFCWLPVFNWLLILVGLPLSIAGLAAAWRRGIPKGMAASFPLVFVVLVAKRVAAAIASKH